MGGKSYILMNIEKENGMCISKAIISYTVKDLNYLVKSRRRDNITNGIEMVN